MLAGGCSRSHLVGKKRCFNTAFEAAVFHFKEPTCPKVNGPTRVITGPCGGLLHHHLCEKKTWISCSNWLGFACKAEHLGSSSPSASPLDWPDCSHLCCLTCAPLGRLTPCIYAARSPVLLAGWMLVRGAQMLVLVLHVGLPKQAHACLSLSALVSLKFHLLRCWFWSKIEPSSALVLKHRFEN